jgi:Raf kinase inhibitor-like YbhB/YbcL family protein
MNQLTAHSAHCYYKTNKGTTENTGGFMMHYSRLIKLTSLILLFAGFFGIGCGHSSPDSMITTDSTISLSSSAFSNTGTIPLTYYYNDGTLGSDYKNYSPPLQWSGIPSSAKSLVVIASCDTDNTVNWVLYMPGSSTTSLAENASATGSLPTGSIQGKNRYGTTGYAGPFPYSDKESYEYVFMIHAIDTELALSSAPSLSDINSAMDGHIIGTGYITGYSSRMTLTTTAFSEGGFIPVSYTSSCGDYIGNANPDLTWTNEPSSTRSYVIIVEDQNGHANWIVYNIAAINTSIPQGSDNARPHPPGSTFGTNYGGAEDYDGPYSSGQLMTYYFRLYALDTVLDEQALGHATRTQILSAMQGHILNEAVVSGKFINLELSSTGRDSETGYWNDKYRFLGIESSINPAFTWNSSGVPSNGVSMVFLGTKMKNGSPLDDNITTWVLYIPQIDPYLYEITENCSWNIHPGNWIQGLTGRNEDQEANWQDRGYDGFAYYKTSFGTAHYYRFGLYVLASTLGIATSDIGDATYDSVMTAMESATILNKAFITGAYLNTTTDYPSAP